MAPKKSTPKTARGKSAGRPRLSEEGRTVIVSLALCPEHVEWLDAQAGGRSAIVRRLIDQERRS